MVFRPERPLPRYDERNEVEFRRTLEKSMIDLTPVVGVYTPTVASSGGGETLTYTTQTGRFVQTGSLIWFTAHIKLATKSGGSGDIRVNLPVPMAAGPEVALAVYIDNQSATWTGAPIAWIQSASAYVLLREFAAGVVTAAWSKLGATGDIRVSGHYLTA